MEIAIKSDVGQRRTLNEDAAGYFLNTQNVPMIVVCDGIGGHNAGDVASAMALSHLGKRWEEESITDTEDGRVETFEDELGLDALAYEVLDMEATINTGVDLMHLEYTVDVMKIMTDLRREWGIKYPEEEEA